MLDAAMQRRHSAAPGDFFTNGGMHPFHNFEDWENTTRPTVEEAFENSINLAFVRLMRDIREYFIAQNQDAVRIMADPHAEVREAYLRRFADEEGRRFVHRFYRQYRDLKLSAIPVMVAHHARAGIDRRAALFRLVRPSGSVADLCAFLETQSQSVRPGEVELQSLYERQVELGRQRRCGLQREGFAQCLALRSPGGHPARLMWVGVKVALHLGTAQQRKLTINVGVEMSLGDRQLRPAHFTLRSAGGVSSPMLRRSFSRARDSRDITVPIGTPSARADSA
jgi:hypothetical protein